MPGAVPSGNYVVMANRRDPVDSLDFFPTPPWATRALMEHVIHDIWHNCSVWEPAAGKCHMSAVLGEYFSNVRESDVHDYGEGYPIGSFVGDGPDVIEDRHCDWIITNPPFNLAIEFAERALELVVTGVALLVRSVWSEGGDRYDRLFSIKPPTTIAQFSERVPMIKGRWNPKASTATSYAWFVWQKGSMRCRRPTEFVWIPPGQRAALTRPDDVARFTEVAA